MLSELFGIHIEALLVKKQNVTSTELEFSLDKNFEDRILFYCRKLSEFAA